MIKTLAQSNNARQALHMLFVKGQYVELYQRFAHIINEI